MQAVLLDENQTSLVALSRVSVPVCDQAGTPLGHIVRHGNSRLDKPDWKDRWIECWNEWYFETEETNEFDPTN